MAHVGVGTQHHFVLSTRGNEKRRRDSETVPVYESTYTHRRKEETRNEENLLKQKILCWYSRFLPEQLIEAQLIVGADHGAFHRRKEERRSE
jgi:hypothetical protein